MSLSKAQAPEYVNKEISEKDPYNVVQCDTDNFGAAKASAVRDYINTFNSYRENLKQLKQQKSCSEIGEGRKELGKKIFEAEYVLHHKPEQQELRGEGECKSFADHVLEGGEETAKRMLEDAKEHLGLEIEQKDGIDISELRLYSTVLSEYETGDKILGSHDPEKFYAETVGRMVEGAIDNRNNEGYDSDNELEDFSLDIDESYEVEEIIDKRERLENINRNMRKMLSG